MTSVIHTYCNPYGAETGGAKRFLGETGHKVFHQWHCDNLANGRYILECAHGHRGIIMHLCDPHARAYRNRDIEYCPRCNLESDHRCTITLREAS